MCLDQPNLKIIGQVDPSDIQQGHVGDCWLLSGIATLAEYDGAVRRLFRKTKDFDLMPFRDKPNLYTITLWDLKTWKEVDIVINERLCSRPNENHPTDRFFGAKPSADGELWVAYLEKALVVHCGGWDTVDGGGQCTHAWSLLTGVKEQHISVCNERIKSGFVMPSMIPLLNSGRSMPITHLKDTKDSGGFHGLRLEVVGLRS